MGGQSFAFISHLGKVQICGFLETEAGDLRAENLNFKKVWETSELFQQMRDISAYNGRCGYCEFAKVCGGCRARAFAMTGDYMAEEPFCLYEPKSKPKPKLDDVDDLDKKILSVIQTDFPVTPRPFDTLTNSVGADGENVIDRVQRMFDCGVVRRLGAIFDSKSLGYFSALIAAHVEPERLDEVAAIISELPGVTHNYRREHHYNLWFTLIAESARRHGEILEDLQARTGVEKFFALPALKVYKIRVNFQMEGTAPPSAVPQPASSDCEPVQLSDDQKQLVRLLQESIPMVDEPFDAIGKQFGWSAEQVIQQIDNWRRDGVIRRFGVVVLHNRLGFLANGMAVVRVSDDQIDRIGAQLANRPEISHCYRRPSLEGFDFNLYAMVHGHSKIEVNSIVADIVNEIGPCEHTILFSTTEYKKTSAKYFL